MEAQVPVLLSLLLEVDLLEVLNPTGNYGANASVLSTSEQARPSVQSVWQGVEGGIFSWCWTCPPKQDGMKWPAFAVVESAGCGVDGTVVFPECYGATYLPLRDS